MGQAVDPDGIHTRTELGAALTRLREQRGFTVRDLARRLDVSPGTLGDYFAGRHVPSMAQRPLVRRLLEQLGVAAEGDVEQWIAAIIRARNNSDRRTSRGTAPYRGLSAFEPDDADVFFGRDGETAALLEQLRRLAKEPGESAGILAVVGPSGSGKSSLLRAGVVAAIRDGALDTEDEHWTCELVTPTTGPATRLPRNVLVVDQFEEVFTALDEAGRAAYLEALAGTEGIAVLGLRADFYASAATEPVLLGALRHAQVLVGPMTEQQLRAAIVRPAQEAGASVEDGLVELILADLAPHDAHDRAHDAGALPLLSHALLATWDRAGGKSKRLTIADYRAAGGIHGAVQRSAEAVYGSLTPEQQDVARQVFVRLVHLDDDVAVTRRRVAPDELRQLPGVDEVLARFVAGRLVTAEQDSVEITHEALLAAWPRLRDWIDTDRAGLRLQRQITDAANAWNTAGRDPELLLRGSRLAGAVELLDDRVRLNQSERAYVEASSAAAAAERDHERRRSRRLGQLLLIVAVLAVAASLFAAYAFNARSTADSERAAANAARDDALSRQVAFQSQALQDTDPALAEQLALVAYEIAPTDTARGAVIDESARPVITRVLGVQGPTALGLSSDGQLIAVSHANDGSVHLYATRVGKPPRPLGVIPHAGDGTGQVFAIAFSRDGHTLAAGGQGGHVHLWDVADPSRPQSLAVLQPAFVGAVESIAFSPDGTTVVAGSAGPHPVQRWAVADHQLLEAPKGVPAADVVQSVAFSADGTQLAVGGSTGTLLWQAAGPPAPTPRSLPDTATVDAVAFTPDGHGVVTGDRAGIIDVWSTTGTPRLVRAMHSATNSQVNTLAISPDGAQLAAGSSDNTLRQWDLASGTALATTNHPGPVTGTAYSPDGRTLLTTAGDGTLRLWSANARLVPTGDGTVFTTAFPRAGNLLAVATNGNSSAIQLWDVSDPDRPRRVGPQLRMPGLDGAAGIRPDARVVAGANSTGQVQLWNTSDPTRPHAIGKPFTAAGALVEALSFSPDGRLLAVGADDNTADVWDVHDPAHAKRLAVLKTGSLVLNTAFSADGRLLAAASADNHAYLWDIHDPAHPVQLARLGGFANYAYGVAFSPNDQLLAVSSADHTTRMWDVRNPRHPVAVGGQLTGPSDYALLVTFSHDGRLLAVASNDRTVWIYNVHDPRHPTVAETLRALGGNVFALAFSPDDRMLVAGGRAPSVGVWTVDPAAYQAQMCPLAGDPITRAEWKQFVPGARYHPPCT